MSIDVMKQALEALEALWQIIDEIDTASDMAKDNDVWYRERVQHLQQKRWQLGITTDGNKLEGGAMDALRAAIEQTPPPPECQTEAEKIAYAFGWYKAFEKHPRYYTIVTTGEDDNLEIVGLYVSDHPVDPTEWRTAFKKFNQELQDEHEAIYQRHGGKLGYGHIPKAHDEYIAFMHKTHPLKPFIEKHNMKQLMFTELWTWGQP